MRRLSSVVFVIAISVFAMGCGARKDLANSDLAVAKFHAQLDAGNFDQIYAESGQGMKNATTKEKLVGLLDAVHRKLGYVKSSNRKGFYINWGTIGKTVRVNYSTQFDSDTAAEEFVFLVSGDDLQLVGYHINSDVLVTK